MVLPRGERPHARVRRKIGVLVVDDSVVVRRILRNAIESDPEFEVVGTAANGRVAVALVQSLRPDAITLDVEMPVMGGIETLKELRRRRLSLPVVMFSTLTEAGARTTIEALSLGASDYAPKPSQTDPEASAEEVRRTLLPKLKALCRQVPPPCRRRAPAPSSPPPSDRGRSPIARSPALELVAVGASTGGPNALAHLLPALPDRFPVPVVVVQHMPPVFTRLLAERLDSRTALRVVEGSAGALLEPRTVYVAPGGFHMTVARKGPRLALALDRKPPEHGCRPAADPLFRSASATLGAGALGVVLTGMGRDGCDGARALVEAGAKVVAQDAESSVVWGMAGSVVEGGLAEAVLPLSELAGEIVRRVEAGRPQHPRVRPEAKAG